MKNLDVTTKHIKELFHPDNESMPPSRTLFAKFRTEFKKTGAITLSDRSIPRDWFLNHLKEAYKYSDNDIEEIRTKLEEIDRE